MSDEVYDWTKVAGTAVNACFCTGKCRTLGYCPANPPLYPDKWDKPRIRVKAWRTENEDNPKVDIAVLRFRTWLRKSLPNLWVNWARVVDE